MNEKIETNNYEEERKIIKLEYTYAHQLAMINQLYLNYTNNPKKRQTDISFCIKKEINKKINGYKHQDIKKGIYNDSLLINMEDILEKMVASKLKCFYCKCNVNILYKFVREESQWTLDRIDNDLCHSSDNTIISCLKCNLNRRNTNKEKFLFTRNLKIKKLDY